MIHQEPFHFVHPLRDSWCAKWDSSLGQVSHILVSLIGPPLNIHAH